MLDAEAVDIQKTYLCLHFYQEVVKTSINFFQVFILRQFLAGSIDSRTNVEYFLEVFELEFDQVLTSSAFVKSYDFFELSFDILVVTDIPQYFIVVSDELFQAEKIFCQQHLILFCIFFNGDLKVQSSQG